MNVIREGNLEFTFGPSWDVLKYDEEGCFYKSQVSSKIESTKAVDFLCIKSDQPLLMLEAKDFSLAVPKREKFEKVPLNVAKKIRDTVAGIIGGSHCCSATDEQMFFKKSYRKMIDPPRIVYFFEDLGTTARNIPQLKQSKKSILQKQLKEYLRWLTNNVVVVGLDNYQSHIDDLTIRRI